MISSETLIHQIEMVDAREEQKNRALNWTRRIAENL